VRPSVTFLKLGLGGNQGTDRHRDVSASRSFVVDFERQMEGIAKAKAEGVYVGRKSSIDVAKVRQPAADGVGGTEIAARNISRASVYRLLDGAAA